MQEVEQLKAKLPLPSLSSSVVPVNYPMYIHQSANTKKVQCCQKEHGFTGQKSKRASTEDWLCAPAT